LSIDAQKRYINQRTGKIKENILMQDADILPKRHRSFKSFKNSFGGVNYFEYKIKNYSIVIDIKYAFNHFVKNTYNEYRSNINATLLPTLTDPILIVKEIKNNQEYLQFYKAFKNDNNLYHIIMFKAKKQENGKYYFKTIFKADSLTKIERLIKALDINTVYFKFQAEGNGS